jgi:hypothetical protein
MVPTKLLFEKDIPMKTPRFGRLLAVTTLLAATAGIAGCGVLFGWATFPAAVATNKIFSFKGHVVDPQDKPVDGCLVKVEVTHLVWAAVEGLKNNDNVLLRKIGPTFEYTTRGTDSKFIFTKEGFQERTFFMDDLEWVSTDEGLWPNVKDFPVVMIPDKKPTSKSRVWSDSVSYMEYPRTRLINPLSSQDDRTGDANEPEKFPDGRIYLTIKKEPPRVINAKGDVDPLELNMPGSITLRTTDKEGGFIRIEPRLGFPPMLTSDQAPAEGYVPELSFDRKRLLDMRKRENARKVIEGYEYFFFRVNGHYGKGRLAWSDHVDSDEKTPVSLRFTYNLWTQPEKGNRELIGCDECAR